MIKDKTKLGKLAWKFENGNFNQHKVLIKSENRHGVIAILTPQMVQFMANFIIGLR